MLKLYGQYDVVVVGAGVTGIMGAIAAGRAGSRVLLVEASSFVGGNLTGGRQTKPTGHVLGGIFREMIDRVAARGAADPTAHQASYGADGGIYDPEEMQRAVIEMLDEAAVEVLLHAGVTDVLVAQGGTVMGAEIAVKSGRRLILATTVIDASGDGDVAVLSGAQFQVGRPTDGKTQPMSAYVRLLGVDFLRFVEYVKANRDDFKQVTEPEKPPADVSGYALKYMAMGLNKRIKQAQDEGFDWIVPKDHITVKSGLFPDEVNINVTRVPGDALDERVFSRAEIEVRRQAYCCYEFLRRYVPGFEKARMLEVAPKLGIRETRRIVGDYILTREDVTHEARFPDAVGLTNCPVDVHDPDGHGAIMLSVGAGYGIPYRALLPKGLDGILVAGRCASVDHIAFGSTRNLPACAAMGEAAGVAAALAARGGTSVRRVPVADIQAILRSWGIPLGEAPTERRAAQPVAQADAVTLGGDKSAL